MTMMTKGANIALSTSSVRATISWSPGPGVPDVDVSALLLTDAGKVRSDADFVFYNAPQHASGSVVHAGKQVAARATDAVTVDLGRIEPGITRVVVGASADGGTFGQVPGLRLEVTDAASGATVATFDIADATTETAFLFGEVYLRNGAWKFRAVGQGYASGLAGLATDFGISVDDEPAPANPPAPATPAAPPLSLKKQKLIDMEKRVAAESPALLSLTKKVGVNLEKRGLGEHTARVALCLDISGSMSRLYRDGKIQALAERVLALGLRFDDDGEVDVFLFGKNGYAAGTINLGNHRDFIAQSLRQYGLEPATYYGKAMQLVREHYFGDSQPRREPRPDTLPVYAMFVTDGAANDERVAREQVTASSFEPLFWQFMAIGKSSKSIDSSGRRGGRSRFGGGGDFRFLEELDDMPGRHVDNADFFAVEDPAGIPDDMLFDLLMTEYPKWLEQARSRQLLR
jgi:stress response protein SCP2